jgi:hypothetical protein
MIRSSAANTSPARPTAWPATPPKAARRCRRPADHSPFGTIYGTNITPDKEYGIGNYSDDEFFAA